MPLFEYRCARCGAVSEFLEGVGRDAPKKRCRSCGGATLARIPSAGRVVRGVMSSSRVCDPSSCGHAHECGDASCAGGTCGLA